LIRKSGPASGFTPQKEDGMAFFDSIMKLTPYPLLSALVWVIAALSALYLARKYVHQTIAALVRLLHNSLRLAAASVRLAEERLVRRNREVLIEKGRQRAERRLGREFYQINRDVEKNLKDYASLHRQVSAIITRFETDHRRSLDVPPALPNWVPVIEAVAAIEHPGDTMVAGTLADIHATLEKQHAAAIESYRNASKTRHDILTKMLPLWLKLQKTLGDLKDSVGILIDRSRIIDRHMAEYEQIREGSDAAGRALLMSSLTQFLVSGLFLIVAVGGAVINVHLIALPMSEMVGGGNYIGPFKTSVVAAIVITTVELSLGLFIMESLRITRLFPVIFAMDDTRRSRFFWCLLALLFIFAGVESSLAILRDRMIADMASLKQMLAGAEQTENPMGMIPAVAQMIIGFLLPFWIALGAIPLATFLSSTRSILGVMAAGSLRFIFFALRLCGTVTVYAGKLMTTAYDLIIFPTLWLETALTGAAHKGDRTSKAKSTFGFLKKFKSPKKDGGSSIELEESRK
jgi:hypothetical protein